MCYINNNIRLDHILLYSNIIIFGYTLAVRHLMS